MLREVSDTHRVISRGSAGGSDGGGGGGFYEQVSALITRFRRCAK